MAEPTSGHLRLSVVIPSHVRADLLRLCLASVERFAPSGTEIIVVDDGSPGGVVSRTAREYGAIRIIRHARARGFCASANAGVALASAPVVQLLNDDAEVTEGWAESALQSFADKRVAAVAPLVLQNDSHRRAAGLPALIDTAGDEYDFGGFARKRGRRTGVRSLSLSSRKRLRRFGMRCVLSARRDPPRRGLPRALPGILRGRGFVVPAAATGIRHSVRSEFGGVASRVRAVTEAGLRAESSNSSRATRNASFGGTSEDTNGCAGCRVMPLSWPARRLSAFRSEHSCHGSLAVSGPSLSPRTPSVLSEHLHTSEAFRKLGLKELARSRYLHLELPSRYPPSPPSAYDPVRVHRPTVHVGRLHGAVHEHPAGRCPPRARADGARFRTHRPRKKTIPSVSNRLDERRTGHLDPAWIRTPVHHVLIRRKRRLIASILI